MNLSRILNFILLLSLLGPLVSMDSAIAQSFDRGYSQFKKKRYRQAKRTLKRSLRETSDRYDKALIYKLLGV